MKAFPILALLTVFACDDGGSGTTSPRSDVGAADAAGDAEPDAGPEDGGDEADVGAADAAGDAEPDAGPVDGGAEADDVAADSALETDPETLGVCGDGQVDEGESCDDGNEVDGDYCSSDCLAETGACGDGTQQENENCDDGNVAPGDYCSVDCLETTGACGDAEVQGNEACDDGNTDPDDYCASDCQSVTGACGDGTTQVNEACDDGNENPNDHCAADCQAVTGRCGDGQVQGNESCDDGQTQDCAGTHNGGDGTCVPLGQCIQGYIADNQGNCVRNPTGLTVPCENGPGWTVWRFHYDRGSDSARIDVWDATCEYSFAPNSACNVREVYPGFGDLQRTGENYPITTSREYIRVRFSATGLRFSEATLHLRGRSYSTNSSTTIRAWSPLYGDQLGGPVDNDFNYEWYAMDWSDYLRPSDSPGLTAVQIYAQGGSGRLAVAGMELCVQ